MTSSARRRARISLAVIAAISSLAIVFAGPSAGGVSLLVQATATGSPSTSPSPSASPTHSSTPRPSPTSTPAPRDVSLITSRRTVTWGNEVVLSGQIVSTDPECEAQEAVVIRRRVFGASSFRILVTAHTDSEGRFETRQEARRLADYKATLSRGEGCGGAASDLLSISVRVIVSASVSDNPIQQGTFFTISGHVKPGHAGTKVFLDRKVRTGWDRIDGVRLDRGSDYIFTLVAGWAGERTFRVRWPSQDHDHETNKSRVLTINSI